MAINVNRGKNWHSSKLAARKQDEYAGEYGIQEMPEVLKGDIWLPEGGFVC